MKQFLTYAIVILLSFMNVSGQISPGDLSEKHKHLEGIRNCTNCHILGEKETTPKCLDCHKEIAVRVLSNKGYHASDEVKEKACAVCHNDHHGREFQLIELDKDQFDHSATGYELKGTHSKQECSACHKKEFIKNEDIKKKTSTYMGLQQECVSCHLDVHRETLPDNCTDCHGMDHFKPAPGFRHDLTDFNLLGKHKTIGCEECHPKEIIDDQVFHLFSNLDHQNCTSCHEDIHNDKFGQNCTKCHSEQSFHAIKNMASFDHSTTGYPLNGMHSEVECKSCHASGYVKVLEYDNCKDCHSDYHKGEFASGNQTSDCNKCHTEQGFHESLYAIDQHNETDFKLHGAHMATPCFACHQDEKGWHFRNIGTKCSDCHQNAHKDQMDEAYQAEGCSACHAVFAWSEIVFDHDSTGFPLLGGHADLSCGKCHYFENEAGITVQKFSVLDNSCVQCHTDIHLGQFEKYGDNGCANCHTYTNWKAEKFNHDDSRFKLEGAHLKLDCVECHQLAKISKEKGVKYIFDEIECETCHK